jgi:RimJ/RimL family protein N-acetyltransferase
VEKVLYPMHLPARLTDGVVKLDAHTLSDAEQIVAGEDGEISRRFDGGRPTTLAKAEEFVRQYASRWIAGGPEITYALRLPDGTLVGGAELRRPASHLAEVGYWVFPAFRGNGYARRALALLCRSAAEATEGLAEISAQIEPDNVASRRTAESVGFSEAGHVEENGVTRLRFVRAIASSEEA